MTEDFEKETRVSIGDVAGRMLMALDLDGERRFLRCDKEGYLLCKVVMVDEEEVEVAEE